MTDYLVTDTELISVANAIRTRGGTQAQLEWPSGYVSAIAAIPSGGGSVEIVPWSTGTDEQIVAMIEAAHNGDIDLQEDGGWAVGDVRTITVGSFVDGAGITHEQQNIDIVISQFGDYMNCGCVMQFDFKTCLAKTTRINSDMDNTSYGMSEMKTVSLPALVNALPNWLKNSLIEFSVLVGEGASPHQISTVTGNKLALRSVIEVLGTSGSTVSGEGSLIDYYTTSANRVKPLNGSVNNVYYVTRSPYTGNNTQFMQISPSGGTDKGSASGSQAYSPFGCL